MDLDLTLHGDARLHDGVLVIHKDGFAEFPRWELGKTSFTLFFAFRLTSLRERNILVGDWTYPWQFMVTILPNGGVGVNLRKNINSMGSDPLQDLVAMEGRGPGPKVISGEWTHVAVVWNRETQQCISYVNGDESERVVAAPAASLDLQENDHEFYRLGSKEDHHLGSPDGRFSGAMSVVEIFYEPISPEDVQRHFQESLGHVNDWNNSCR